MDYTLPKTIDQVIDQLEEIINDAIDQKEAIGIFAALYQRVTIRVREGIKNNEFEDNSRMEKLDVVFANRFLLAYHQYQNQIPTTLSWKLAFDSSKRDDLILIQHLLLGINAHINLDLGIAVATINPGDKVEEGKNDFNQINRILQSMTDQVQEDIEKVSPLFWLIDKVGKNTDEKFAEFSIKAARTHAWGVAKKMAGLPSHEWPDAIKKLDEGVEKFGQLIEGKGWLFQTVIRIVRFFETKDVSKQIKALTQPRT